MIKLILEITRNNLFKYRKSERSPQKPLRTSGQCVLIPRKISGTFYAKSREKYMGFEGKMITLHGSEIIQGRKSNIFFNHANIDLVYLSISKSNTFFTELCLLQQL
jgi:hypothetical protein